MTNTTGNYYEYIIPGYSVGDTIEFKIKATDNGSPQLTTYDPDILGTRIPIANWLKRLGKTKHLVKPKNAEILKSFEAEVARRWKRIKAMHEHEEL